MNATQKISDFIAKHSVTLSVKRTDRTATGGDGASHWKVAIRCNGRRMQTKFHMGPALKGEPELSNVLSCLADDAAGFENAQSFDDWCGEYGYDTDSRSALRTFKACERQAAKLSELLGDEAYRELLWETERD